MQNIPFRPATDELGHTAPLDERARFPLLGVPLEVRSNSPAVIEAAERSFGPWRDLAPELVEPAPPLVVDVVVHGGGQPHVPRAPFVHRAHGGRVVAASGASMLTMHMEHGAGVAFVTPELVAEDLHFRYNVLECMALALSSRRDRTPIHAGAVARKGKAVLLVGRSTAGKSTLCYACLRDGFQLLAEDVVYVGLRGGLRLWGNPWRVHLLPDAWRHFPELADVPPQVQANGKHKLAVDVSALGAERLRRYADRAAICLVQRSAGVESALEPIDPQILIDTLCRELESGFDLHASVGDVAGALVAGGAYRLSAGSDLAGAVALLRQLTDEGG